MLILVRPHSSLLDGPIVARYLQRSNLPRATFAVDPDYAKHPLWGRALSAYGRLTGRHTMVALDASHPFSMRKILRLLQEDRDVVIFPQGTGIKNPERPDQPGIRWLLHKASTTTILHLTLSHHKTIPAVIDCVAEHPHFVRSLSPQYWKNWKLPTNNQ